MISLVKLQRILVFNPLDFLHDTFLKHKMGVFCLLADDFRVLFHLMVQFLHFLVANHLFRQKLVLFSLVLDQIQDPRVHTILLDLIEMHSAYVTLTADFLPLLQKIGNIRIGFFSQSKFIQSHRFIVIELGSAGSSRVGFWGCLGLQLRILLLKGGLLLLLLEINAGLKQLNVFRGFKQLVFLEDHTALVVWVGHGRLDEDFVFGTPMGVVLTVSRLDRSVKIGAPDLYTLMVFHQTAALHLLLRWQGH